MKRILEVQHLQDYRLVLKFDDGVSGEIDFSSEPMTGVFAAWKNPQFFAKVSIGDRGRSLVWPAEIDLCADSLWLGITGQAPESLYSGLRPAAAHA